MIGRYLCYGSFYDTFNIRKFNDYQFFIIKPAATGSSKPPVVMQTSEKLMASGVSQVAESERETEN